MAALTGATCPHWTVGPHPDAAASPARGTSYPATVVRRPGTACHNATVILKFKISWAGRRRRAAPRATRRTGVADRRDPRRPCRTGRSRRRRAAAPERARRRTTSVKGDVRALGQPEQRLPVVAAGLKRRVNVDEVAGEGTIVERAHLVGDRVIGMQDRPESRSGRVRWRACPRRARLSRSARRRRRSAG